MGGTAYLIHGDLDPSRLEPVPRHRTLIDRLRGRQRYDETTYSDYGRSTFIDVPPGEISPQIIAGFNDFLAEQLTTPWSATRSLLDYLRMGYPKIYLRGEKPNDSDETDWYVQLSFSGWVGMAEVSARLAAHWAELWVQRDIERIARTILRPDGFTVKRELPTYNDPETIVPVGTAEYGVYASFALRGRERDDVEVDGSMLETQEDEGESLLADIEAQLGPLMADGKCRCQHCMPDYSPAQNGG
jgi:hypothetical protein